MATIKPIRAMRYTEKAGELSTCVCPPYDIVSDGEYNALCAENPHNLIRLELPKGGEDRYNAAGDLLNQWLTEGILAKEEQPGIYLYRETFTVEGKTYSFEGSDSVNLTDVLINLKYDPMKVCRCLPEFTVTTELGGPYGVNLSQGYARCSDGQADLTEEQVELIWEILNNQT